MPPLQDCFFLDPAIHFLNHGSFGAAPKPVLQVFQDWQLRMERQPVLFLGREYAGLLSQARQSLGDYLHADPGELVFIPNATHGVNIIARSMDFAPGDEILTTDHEYGACDYTWEFISQQNGLIYRHQPIALPCRSPEEMLEQLFLGVTPKTRLIFISHITSPTAQTFPVKEICQRAGQLGIYTLVDGAHAPGQLDLDLVDIRADFYTGNCHKWLMAPKGAGFLYARRELHHLIQPLVVSWGYKTTPETTSGSRLVDFIQWTGTHNPAAYLAVPEAIRFRQAHDWPSVQMECHRLLSAGLREISRITGLPSAYPPGDGYFSQMAITPLPADTDCISLKTRLYDEYQVEVPLTLWNEQKFARISVQGYNTPDDLFALIQGLKDLLPL